MNHFFESIINLFFPPKCPFCGKVLDEVGICPVCEKDLPWIPEEQVVVLCDEQFRQFQETGLKDDQIFLFDYSDKMWFDPGSLCWHCVLVKGETGKEGILVDAEGYSYARYAAFASDCDRLRLQDIPVHYEHPARVPEQKKTRKRKEPER